MACWAYAVSALVLSTILWGLGDRWWLATLLLYGPRWAWGLPLVILIPASVAVRPRSLRVVFVGSVVVVGPVMGFCVPWRSILSGDAGGSSIRVLTCNVQDKHLDSNALRTLIARSHPQVVALQEWPTSYEPIVSRREGWYVRDDRAGAFFLASRYPIRTVEPFGPIPEDRRVVAIRYGLEVPGGTLYVVNVHLATPRAGLEPIRARGWAGVPDLRANIALRRKESEAVSRWVGQHNGPTLLAGDFNMPCESIIFREFWSRYRNAFTEAGLGLGHTRFTRWHGARIDHVLIGPRSRVRRCWVGPDVGSDHRPLVADIGLPGDDR